MEEFYYSEITEASFAELKQFAAWMNRFFGHYPTIVGGWAVWCYTKGLGSRDIDVVFINRDVLERALSHFFYHNDYEEIGFLEKTYVKKIRTPKREEEIMVDACTAADTRHLETLNIELPWRWATEDSQQHELDEKANVYIPNPELLLTYKIGAALGRMEALKTVVEKAYTQSKIWKDLFDAGSLLRNCPLNPQKVTSYLEKSGIQRHRRRFTGELISRHDILERLDLPSSRIEEILM